MFKHNENCTVIRSKLLIFLIIWKLQFILRRKTIMFQLFLHKVFCACVYCTYVLQSIDMCRPMYTRQNECVIHHLF